ncbi:MULTISPECIES: hypothetical protein [Erwinia]|uniref:Uncharacterized protein n=1 Tax=Erwinia rhapontici TaxID=55212 RepID=A0ABN6DQV9_ERWRD|nr:MULTISPECIES: hypothetical protein [Erwinia]MBP2153173.1 hypothetical protein [Erwinia rhapontici]NNS09810.1 hypothetical protein [Erwinia sp. JH02]BCQ37086.1 hypothetical protein ERHA53_44290 [Erwinia rhapontici]BCQ42100.1 hypothetical protein ERHA54_47030 [Erwinia rhapontici]BCQ47451.1 hypothetical protein ERHA55_49780 [Erwinia rhapontici]
MLRRNEFHQLDCGRHLRAICPEHFHYVEIKQSRAVSDEKNSIFPY